MAAHSLSCACVSPGAFSDFCHVGDAVRQDGSSSFTQPLWLKDMYKPLTALRVKNQ
ncbi:hypothetical protein H8959_007721, partial [Pygathrix nigripes]